MLRNKIKLNADEALKLGDSKKVGALRYLLSIIDKKALTMPPESFSEREEVSVLQKELKNKQEAKELFEKAKRADLVSEQDYEIEILKNYLPVAMDTAELEKIVDSVIEKLCKDMVKPYPANIFGNIMREVGIIVSGKAEGSEIAKIVKNKIS
jgi:uncharacterized protein YqeY